MQGFPPPDVDLTNANEGLVMLLPIFFYPQIRNACQLQVRSIQAIQASIIYMGNGKFLELFTASLGHYCMHCWGFKTGLKWGETLLAPKSTYYIQQDQVQRVQTVCISL